MDKTQFLKLGDFQEGLNKINEEVEKKYGVGDVKEEEIKIEEPKKEEEKKVVPPQMNENIIVNEEPKEEKKENKIDERAALDRNTAELYDEFK